MKTWVVGGILIAAVSIGIFFAVPEHNLPAEVVQIELAPPPVVANSPALVAIAEVVDVTDVDPLLDPPAIPTSGPTGHTGPELMAVGYEEPPLAVQPTTVVRPIPPADESQLPAVEIAPMPHEAGQLGGMQTGIRGTVVQPARELPDDTFRDVIVRVNETRTGQVMIGGAVNSNAGLVGNVVAIPAPRVIPTADESEPPAVEVAPMPREVDRPSGAMKDRVGRVIIQGNTGVGDRVIINQLSVCPKYALIEDDWIVGPQSEAMKSAGKDIPAVNKKAVEIPDQPGTIRVDYVVQNERETMFCIESRSLLLDAATAAAMPEKGHDSDYVPFDAHLRNGIGAVCNTTDPFRLMAKQTPLAALYTLTDGDLLQQRAEGVAPAPETTHSLVPSIWIPAPGKPGPSDASVWSVYVVAHAAAQAPASRAEWYLRWYGTDRIPKQIGCTLTPEQVRDYLCIPFDYYRAVSRSMQYRTGQIMLSGPFPANILPLEPLRGY